MCEIASTISGCLGTHQRTAPVLALSGQRTGELIAQALVLTEHISDLTAAYTDITGRHIRVRTDMTLQLGHETLAETHHLGITLPSRREIRTALGTAHRQGRERVLERLLEREELHDTQVHTRVETDTAFVRTDGAVHLNTETAVDLHLTLIVHPRHTEHNDPFGLYNTFHHFLLAQVRICHNHRSNALNYFFYCLMKLVFTGVFADEVGHKTVHIHLSLFIHFRKESKIRGKVTKKILHTQVYAEKIFHSQKKFAHVIFF